jgi:hypothetical protein
MKQVVTLSIQLTLNDIVKLNHANNLPFQFQLDVVSNE